MRRKIRVQKTLVPSDVHRFTRKVVISPIVGVAGGVVLGNFFSALSELPNASEFGLFDQYQLTYVKVKYWLNQSPDAQAAAVSNFPRLFTAVDYTEIPAPATLNALREYGNCKIRALSPYRPVVCKYRPATLQQMYSDPTGGVSPKWREWLSTARLDVPHFGHLWGIDGLGTQYTVTREVQMWFRCKHTK